VGLRFGCHPVLKALDSLAGVLTGDPEYLHMPLHVAGAGRVSGDNASRRENASPDDALRARFHDLWAEHAPPTGTSSSGHGKRMHGFRKAWARGLSQGWVSWHAHA
jgi:hypothetical protein